MAALCSENSDLNNLIKKNNIGFAVPNNDFKNFIKELKGIMKNYKKLELFRSNARELALNKFSRNKSIGKFQKLIDQL